MFESRKRPYKPFLWFQMLWKHVSERPFSCPFKGHVESRIQSNSMVTTGKKGQNHFQAHRLDCRPPPPAHSNRGKYTGLYIYIYVGIPKPSKIFQKFCWFLGAKTCGKGGEGLRLLSSPFSNLEFSFLDGNAVGVLHGLVAACKAPPTMPFEKHALWH